MKISLNSFTKMHGNFYLTCLLLFGMLIAANSASASEDNCDKRAPAIIQHAYPSAKSEQQGFVSDGLMIKLPLADSIGNTPHTITCRIWPLHPNLLLVAVPLIAQTSDSGNQGDLEILVLDNATLEVKQRLRIADRMSDDAISIRSIAFDTARYQVRPDITAFGLRIDKASGSNASPYEEVDLWLYAVIDNRIHPLLDGIIATQAQGEWDTNCAGHYNDIARTLAINSSSHNDFADITVSEKRVSSVSAVGDDGNCREKQTELHRSTYRLIYDGNQYKIPKELKLLD